MDAPWTRDAYLVLHVWLEPDGEVRGRITHPQGPGVTSHPALGSDGLTELTAAAVAVVTRRLQRETSRGR